MLNLACNIPGSPEGVRLLDIRGLQPLVSSSTLFWKRGGWLAQIHGSTRCDEHAPTPASHIYPEREGERIIQATKESRDLS